jgi:FtsP/CotA-like multicopper oxidase with cupredoxin domain
VHGLCVPSGADGILRQGDERALQKGTGARGLKALPNTRLEGVSMGGWTRREILTMGGLLAASVAATMAGCNTGGGSVTLAPEATSTGSIPAAPSPTASPLGPALRTVESRSSVGGVLDTTLHVRFTTSTIGTETFSTRTYEGGIPGPVLRVKQGDTLRILVDNGLPPNVDADEDETQLMNTAHHLNTTNLHTHGLHVSPQSPSDDILLEIDPASASATETVPGTQFRYEYQIPGDHPEGSYWYHPHVHGSSAIQTMNGMSGALIIEGPTDEVAEIAAAREVILFFQQITLNDEGESPTNFDEIDGPALYTVNGQLQPVLYIGSGEVQRWRLLNCTWETFFPLQLDGHAFHQIAFDGITFPAPAEVGQVFLSPANRADVLVRGGTPGTYVLRKLSYYQESDAPRPEVDLLTVVVTPGDGRAMSLPTTLPAPASLSTDFSSGFARTRTLTFMEGVDAEGETTFPIIPYPGGPPEFYDANRVDQTMQLGTAEEWTLLNTSPDDHPFHIHINPFYVVEMNYQPVATPFWADTIIIPKQVNGVPGQVKFRTRFLDFTGQFVLHCHIFDHADSGMMELVEVV